MYLEKYDNHEFSHYLNRHLLGIMKLSDKIKKLSLFFELSEAFSNYACRLYIDVDFIDGNLLNEQEIRLANRFFYNYLNETGNRFVSYIYKPQRSYHIDVKEIELFITHYQLAKNLLQEVVKNLVPGECVIKVEELETQPLFNYVSEFLQHQKYEKDKESFEKEYFQMTKRHLEFDCLYHNIILKAANKVDKVNWETTVTDKELYEAGAGDLESIRKYVVESKVSFSLWYNTDVVREIYMDMFSLKDKIEVYTPESSYKVLNKAIILKIIVQKEQQLETKANLAKHFKEQLGADVGDYILVGKLGNDDIGVVKNITTGYDDKPRIEYSALNKNLSESKASTKTTDRSNIFFVVKSEDFSQDLKTNALKNKDQVIRLYKERLSIKGSKQTRKK